MQHQEFQPPEELRDIIKEQLHAGHAILLDFKRKASLQTWAGEYGGRIKYMPGCPKDRLDISALLIRPDGVVAWACDEEQDCEALQTAAARWFVGTNGPGHPRRLRREWPG